MADNDSAQSAAATNARGVVTHEYGHYMMCSLMVNKNPGSLALLVNRLGEGAADSRDDWIAVSFESFADLFASQVAGGTNYVDPNSTGFTRPNNNNMEYCVGAPCVETELPRRQ